MLEVSDIFSTNLNVFGYVICQFRLNILKSFITMLYDFMKDSGSVVLLEKPQLIPENLFYLKKRKKLKMGRNIKTKIFIWQLEGGSVG